jgi:hypothetical protein
MSRGRGTYHKIKIGTLRSSDLRVGMAKPPSMSRGRDRKSRQKHVEQVYKIN